MFPIIDLAGNAFERGYRHGVEARTRIAGSIRCYASLFASCGIDWLTAQTRARAYRDLIAGLGEVFDEIDGIAAGSGFLIDEILALNCRTEILPPVFLAGTETNSDDAFARNRAIGMQRVLDIGECTSFAVSGIRCADGATRIGQNWDWVGFQRANMVILRTHGRTSAPDFMTLTEAGMVAKIGINAHGLAVGLNIVRAENDREKLGIPVHIFQRLALDFANVEAVLGFSKSLVFSGSSNAILGDSSGRIGSLEYSPNGVALLEADQGVVAHTNHFCDPTLAKFQAPLADSLTTKPRLARAQQHLMGWPDRVTTRNLTTFLRDETSHDGSGKLGAICRSPDASLPPELRIESVCGVIINCNAREMLVAPGLPSQVEFSSISF
jgi:isopenicillin-N N-acyltransferase like protein